MSETKMWGVLERELAKHLHLERMPSGGFGASSEGVPDVAWLHSLSDRSGWLELKFLPRWPKAGREYAVLPWKSPAQPLFLRRWGAAGGRASVLLAVGTDWRDWVLWSAPRVKAGSVEWVRAMQTAEMWKQPHLSIDGRLHEPGITAPTLCHLLVDWLVGRDT